MVVVLMAMGALAFLLGEPHLEGRNKHATLFEVYFKDPALAYVYVASVPFFVALYRAFELLGFARNNQPFSPRTVTALRTIKYCAIAILGFVVVSVAFMPFGDPDDRPPGVVMRIVAAFGAIVVAAMATTLERIFENAFELKSENDLTV